MTMEGGWETRSSLLRRLRADDDPEAWREFYRVYGGLIRSIAAKAGLNIDEAEEVVQETAIGVARRLPDFVYDPKICRFKTWLLNLTRWRISNQLRKRAQPGSANANAGAGVAPVRRSGDGSSTHPIHRILDPAVPEFGAEWDEAWERHLVASALERVRGQVDERQYQIFDLYVTKGWPARDVARTLRLSLAKVYLAKHRVAAVLRKEVRRLEKKVELRSRRAS